MADDFGLQVGRYNAALPTLTDGDPVELQVDVNGRLLVQADVTVLNDFLGLNGAADSSNILVAGTEDGTGGGTAHAIRVDTGGQVVISDGGGSITVDGSVDVSATDLDIRDLTASQDNVAISDGTDTLAVNADGSINVTINNATVTVDATDLDIRDLSASQDNVAISDGTDTLEVNADGSINSVVTATDLDIRDLSSASDSVEVLQATHDNLNLNANIQVGDADVANGNPVPVSDAGGSLTVDATDLDIRDLSASQDNVAISDGTDTLAIETDGSINVNATQAALGAEEYTVSDNLAAAGDGEIAVSSTYTDVASISVGAGETAYIYGWQWACDKNAQARLITDDTTDVITYKTSLNSSAMPTDSEHWSEGGRIEISGAASLELKLQVKLRGGGSGNATGSIHVRKD
jgi:hypothetical protein